MHVIWTPHRPCECAVMYSNEYYLETIKDGKCIGSNLRRVDVVRAGQVIQSTYTSVEQSLQLCLRFARRPHSFNLMKEFNEVREAGYA